MSDKSYSRNEIREHVENFMAKYNLSIPINVNQITQAVNAVIVKYDMPDQFCGTLISPYDEIEQYIIGININHNLNRQRYTIAHEVGHIVLKHTAIKRVCVLFREDNDKNIIRSRIEREANIFAAELLMPQRQLVELVSYHGHNINFLSKFLRVSKQALEIRLSELALTL